MKKFFPIFILLLAVGFIFFSFYNVTSAQTAYAGTSEQTRILAWGGNEAGQLGIGTKSPDVLTPLRATEVEKILQPNFEALQIDSSQYLSCLLRSDKTVWCWGGADSHKPNKPPPAIVRLDGIPPIEELRMGSGYFNCARDESNQYWCFKRQGRDGPFEIKKYQFPALSKMSQQEQESYQKSFTAFDPGMSYLCAVNNQGRVLCWTTEKEIPVPHKVLLPKKVAKLSVGFKQTCTILDDQSVWCFGNSEKYYPVKLFSADEKIKSVFAGGQEGCVLKEDGTLWCWKASELISFYNQRTPKKNSFRVKSSVLRLKQVLISEKEPLQDVIKLDAVGGMFCALRSKEDAFCWGGPSGNPDQKNSKQAFMVKRPNGTCDLEGVSSVTVGMRTGYAIVKGSHKEFEKWELPDRTTEILSAIQSGEFDKGIELHPNTSCFNVDSKLAEEALVAAISAGRKDVVQFLVDAGLSLEMPNSPGQTALLLASKKPPGLQKINLDMVEFLISIGADIDTSKGNRRTVLSNLQRDMEHNRKLIDLIIDKKSKEAGRIFYSHPPSSLKLEQLDKSHSRCQAGKEVFSKPGEYEISIPENCKQVLTKVWGAGGGGSAVMKTISAGSGRGGTGGFSVGVLDVSGFKKIKVIVGGAGKSGFRDMSAEGGFNGGGDGGQFVKQSGHQGPELRYGDGGGGRSEVIIDGHPVIIAGGGGGSGSSGGGTDAKGYVEDYFNLVRRSVDENSRDKAGKPGDKGVGGKAGRKFVYEGCAHGTDGNAKEGGNGGGAIGDALCAAGGGGGGGYGGGGGGDWDAGGIGGGGGGLAPENGITLWGGIVYPANAQDHDYIDGHGASGKDGLVVVSWPAPLPDKLNAHLTKIFPFQKKEKTGTASVNHSSKDSSKKDVRFGVKISQKSSPTQRTIELVKPCKSGGFSETKDGKKVECLESQKQADYGPDHMKNIASYQSWLPRVHPSKIKFFKKVIALMKQKKLSTEFLQPRDKLGLGREGYILSRLDQRLLFVPNTSKDKAGKSYQHYMGRNVSLRLYEKNWGDSVVEDKCRKIDKKKSIYAETAQKDQGDIGIQLTEMQGQFRLGRVVHNTPAQLAGLESGDRLYSIDGKSVYKMSEGEAQSLLKGDVGEAVVLEIRKGRKPGAKKQKISVMRTMSLKKKLSTAKDLFKTDKKPDNDYLNYIIFDEGVFPSDLVWKDHVTLSHKKTGDVISFKYKPCSNFVFSEKGELEDAPNDGIGRYSNLSEIPELLLKRILKTNTEQDTFTKVFLGDFKRLTDGENSIDKKFIEKKKADLKRQYAKKQRTMLLNYDQNLDGVVSFKEIDDLLEKDAEGTRPKQQKSLIKELEKLKLKDLNEDQIIDNDEMIRIEKNDLRLEAAEKKISRRYDPYLSLDPNDDGVLTKDEFLKIVKRTFNTFDLNEDLIISEQETEIYMEKKPTKHKGVKFNVD